MSLVGWWPLHSDTPVDLSGQGNHGTNNGATPGVAGKGGLTAYSFDGSNDYIDTSTIGPSGEFTVSAWANVRDLSTAGDKRIVGNHYGDNGNHFILDSRDDEGSFRFFVDDDTDPLTPKTNSGFVTLNNWYHVVGVFDGVDTATLFVNGIQESQDTHSFGTYNPDINIQIGKRADTSGSYFPGSICDVRIYNRALTQSEIQTLYEWGAGDYVQPKADGVSYYPLDGDADDQWANNDGTVNGASVTSDAVRGQAYEFDGNDHHIEVSHHLEGKSNFTVSAWVNCDDYSLNRVVVGDWGATDNTYLLFWDPDQGFRIATQETGTSVGISGFDTPTENAWYHFVHTWHSTDGQILYINGSEIASTDASIGSLETTSSDLRIGGSFGSHPNWDGEIDDVRFYDYTLTPQEVHDLYRWGTFGRDMRAMTVRA